jgi:hypothetical protein
VAFADQRELFRVKIGIFLEVELPQVHALLNVFESTQIEALVCCELLERGTSGQREVEFY